MSTHLFSVGQYVRLKRKYGLSPATAENYRVTGVLPARDNSPQYRIRSDEEKHDRVATEDTLDAMDAVDGQFATLA